MSRPVLNEPAIRSVVQWIESHPEQWDQRFFASGTGTMCIAGIACHLAGYNLNEVMVDSGTMSVYYLAQSLLGLSDDQADQLFLNFLRWGPDGDNSVDQLREEITEVTGLVW